MSYLLDGVSGRWVIFAEGRMGVLAMKAFLISVNPYKKSEARQKRENGRDHMVFQLNLPS
jgi:hypothetical protein